MNAEVVSGLLALALLGAYFERKGLRTDLLVAKAKVVSIASTVTVAVRNAETKFRAIAYADVARVMNGAKADAVKLETAIKSDMSKLDGGISAFIAHVEADVRRVI
jgi:hypothetical protein